MPVIHVTVRSKIAANVNNAEIICGNSDYIIAFDFDAEWLAYETKTARFVYDNQYQDVVFTGVQCPVPVIRNAVICAVGVYAGDLHTTTPAYALCRRSILCGGGVPADPPEDVYNQIMERLNSGGAGETIPAYVRAAAEAVAEKILGITGEASASAVPDYTNRLPQAIDANGNVYNSVGYMNDKRLSSTGAVADLYSASAGWAVSGFIPATGSARIRVRNVTIDPNSSDAGTLRWCAYDASFAFLGWQSYSNLRTGWGYGSCEFDADGCVTAFSIRNQNYDFTAMAYIRIMSETHFTADSIVTVDEEIGEGGNAEVADVSRVPFTLAFLTDLHWNEGDADRMKRAAQALSVIHETAPLDAVVFGGDYIKNWSSVTAAAAKADIASCRKAFVGAGDAPVLWLRGNHDNNPYPDVRLTKAEIFSRISRSQNTRAGFVSNPRDPYGCYGYMDFENAKIRLVAVNTSDNDVFGMAELTDAGYSALIDAYNIGAKQLQWIADNALDFSGKTDPGEWGVIFVSHVPIYSANAWYNAHSYTDSTGTVWTCNVVNLADLAKAYTDKSSFSVTLNGESVSKDYSGLVSVAQILCFVHGHMHAVSSTAYNGFRFIACPNACNAGEQKSDDNETYTKTAAGTAGETAFTVLTVDPANGRISAVVYGAGYDRTIEIGRTTQ